MPKQQNPKLTLEPNVPTTIRVDKIFASGQNQFGPWYGFSVTEGEVVKSLFANSAEQHDALKPFIGSLVQITQTKDYAWVVESNGKALFDEKGRATPKPKVDPLTDPATMDSIRADRKDVLQQALQDAKEVAMVYNQSAPIPDHLRLDHADIRAMAISMVIEYHKHF